MKNFDEIYKTLSNISTENFDNARKKLFSIKVLVGLIVTILFVIIGTYLLPGFMFFFIVIAIIIFIIFKLNNI